MDNFIERKIKENSGVRVNYKSTIDGKPHYIKGYLTGQTKESFLIEGGRYHDAVVVPRSGIISMFFLKDTRQKKVDVKPDPVISRSSLKQDKKFSYNKWWKNDSIKEAD